MCVEQLLSRLHGVRQTKNGYMALCPAHRDTSPSLSVREGDNGCILLHDFGGCEPGDICAAIRLRLADLFPVHDGRRPCRSPTSTPVLSLEQMAFLFKLQAECLYSRAQFTLKAARALNTSEWTEKDWTVATNAVARAHTDVARSQFLAAVAFDLRTVFLERRRPQLAP
jgi:hypothetical protein